MASYTQLQTRVNRYVIDVTTAVSAEVPTLINEAIIAAEKRHNFKAMETRTTLTTALNTQTLGTIARWKELRARPFLRDGQDGVLGTTLIDWEASLEDTIKSYDYDAVSTNVGGPPELLHLESVDEDQLATVWVFPMPDDNSQWDNGLYRVVIPYWEYLADLSADADDNWFTNQGEEYVFMKAVASAFWVNWDETRAAIWDARAEKELQALIRVDRRARLGRSVTLVPRRGSRGTVHFR